VSALATIGHLLDNAVNPVAAKELRQAVRSRFVTVALLFFLALEFAVVWIYLLVEPSAARSLSGGQGLATALYGILLWFCILFIPIYSGVRLAWERSRTQRDLMFATTISAGAVVRGKLLSAMALAGLIYSVCAPFMVFTYLLRGVDLPSIFMVLGTGLVYVLGAVQFAIFLASIPVSRVAKVLLGLLALGMVSYFGLMSVMFYATAVLGPGVPFLYPGGTPWEAWVSMLATPLAGIGLLYVLSCALLKSPSANRMLPVRLYVTSLWLLGGGLAVGWHLLGGGGDGILVWAGVSCTVFAIWFLVAASERETYGPRLRRQVPRFPLWRVPAFLLYSGAAGGLTWAGLLTLITLAVVLLPWPYWTHSPDTDDFVAVLGGLALYGLAYSLTAVLVRRLCSMGRYRIPHYYTWVIAVAMMAVGSLGPLFVVMLVAYGHESISMDVLEGGPWTFLNPAYLVQEDWRGEQVVVVGLWAFLVILGSIPWALRQMEAFRPPAAEAAPSPPAVNDGS